MADTTPNEWRGTAFGVYNFISGIVLLAASALAGFLWEIGGPEATFLSGGAFTLLAFAGLFVSYLQRRKAAKA